MKTIIKIDGGSRGNPGPSAFGVYFVNQNKSYAEVLGVRTNNEAEYSGLIFALKKVKALLGKDKAKVSEIEIKSDSELLVKQMNGIYKIKDPKIQQLFLEAWNLKVEFKKLTISHIRREQNKEADSLVNQALDAKTRSQKLF